MNARGTTAQHGPRRARGRYDDDATRWWDEAAQRWYPTTGDEDVLEIQAEDCGHTSMLRSITTTLTGQHGTQRYQFVARIRSADPRSPESTVTSGTFPVLPLQLPLDDIDPHSAFAEEMRARLGELEQRLLDEGWRPGGTGDHWWSKRYTRPAVDWARPLET